MTIPNIPEHIQGRHLLNSEDAAEYLRGKYGIRSSAGSMVAKARRGTGPIFRKFGREYLFSYRDLDAWVMENIAGPFQSTDEQVEPAAA